jgi:hypothetical protein
MSASPDPLVWLVFTKPVEGREQEYNEWYDEVHLPDVAAVPGVRAAQRYVLGPERRSPGVTPPHSYLAVYEIDGDPDVVFPEITRRIDSGEMKLSDALDRPATVQTVWHPSGPRLGEA